mmetsp:Transcript_166179/g.533429  ORF Transcript_166179/g.533429 Transcript_166179/m.533429 type:complete len:202 (+) Transcript_166179:1209-1814(+)
MRKSSKDDRLSASTRRRSRAASAFSHSVWKPSRSCEASRATEPSHCAASSRHSEANAAQSCSRRSPDMCSSRTRSACQAACCIAPEALARSAATEDSLWLSSAAYSERRRQMASSAPSISQRSLEPRRSTSARRRSSCLSCSDSASNFRQRYSTDISASRMRGAGAATGARLDPKEVCIGGHSAPLEADGCRTGEAALIGL